VKRFHATIHDLWKAGVRSDFLGFNPVLKQMVSGATCAVNLDPQRYKGVSEFDQALLVADTD
jgi:hypothetical protein